MPYITSQRVRIYYETEGEGPPLVLHHGLAGSLEAWRVLGYAGTLSAGDWRNLGYTDAVYPGFRLILIDARGHGRSAKSSLPEAYRIEFMAADVVAVLDALGIEKAHFWGYSLGAAVGFALAGHAPHRFSSFILGSYSPFGIRSEIERRAGEWFSQGMAVALAQGMEGYVAALEKASRPVPPAFRALLLDNDPRALVAMTKTIYRWQGVGQVLSSVTTPCLLYAGSDDPWHDSLKEAAGRLPWAEFLSLRREDHFSVLYDASLIISQAQRFLLAAQSDGAMPQKPAVPNKVAKPV